MKRKASFAVIFMTIFLDLVGFGMILPILPFYAEDFGASALHIGMMSASFSLMQFIFAPFWGRLSDRYGRRPVILFSLFFSAISLTFFGLANNLVMLFGARIFAGIFMANFSAAQAYIADITTAENRAKGMGMVGAAFGLGFIFGPTIGGVLSSPGVLTWLEMSAQALFGLDLQGVLVANPYRVPAFFAAGLSLLNTLGAWFYLPESRTRAEILASREAPTQKKSRIAAMRLSVLHPVVGIFIFLHFLMILAFANLEATFALFTERAYHYNSTENGYIFAYIGVLIAVMQGGLIGPLTARFGESRLLTAGLAIQGAAFLMLPYTRALPSLLFVVALISIGNGLSTPTLNSLVSRNTARDKQGSVLGVMQSFGSLGRVIGPTWGGYFFDEFGIAAPYWSGGLLLLLCSGIAVYGAANLIRQGSSAEEASSTA